MLYSVIIIFLFILIYQYDFREKSTKKWFCYYSILVVLVCLAGFRYRIGNDTITYEKWFETLPSFNRLTMNFLTDNSKESLFVLFNILIKSIFHKWVFAQIIHAIIINSIVFYFIKKYTSFVFTSVLIYFLWIFYDYNCEILRQSLASSIFLLSVDSLIEKKYLKYYSFAIIAFLFHNLAVVLFILPLIAFFRINKWIFILFILTAICAPILQDNFVNFLQLFKYVGSISEKIFYVDSVYFVMTKWSVFGIIYMIYVDVVIYLII